MGEKPENDTSDLVFLLTDHSSPSHLVSCSPATRQHSDTVQIIIFSFLGASLGFQTPSTEFLREW